MELAAGVEPLEVPDIVGHEDHSIVDGKAGNVLVGSGAQLDVIDMSCREAAPARKSSQPGAQVLIDEQLELAWLKASVLAKSGPASW